MCKLSKVTAIILFGVSSATAQMGGGSDINSKRTDSNTTIAAVRLDMVSIMANRSETDVAKYAGQVSILNQNDLVKSPSIIEDLGSIPGVQLRNDFGRQVGQYFNIRGFGYQSEARVIIE